MNQRGSLWIIAGIILVVALGGAILMTETVPAGHVAVQNDLGNILPNTLPSGFYVKSPFLDYIPVDVRTQAVSPTASAASRDLQDVKAQVTLNYHVQADKAAELYKSVGLGYNDIVITPAIQEAVKASTAEFTADQLITQRPAVKVRIEDILSKKLAPYFIVVETVSITDFSFSEQFNKAIEAKVTAEQDALKAKNELERIKIEKEQAITQAEAIAESTKLKADAEAYSLKVIQEQLAKATQLVQYKSIEKWNGQLPTYMTADAPVPFIDVGGE